MILIDNTVLSNFVLVGELSLLREYCKKKGAITGHVLAEFKRGIEKGLFNDVNLDWLHRLDLEGSEEQALFVNLSRRLGAGEASCLALAIHKKYDLLTDDMAVRKIALREGIRLSGSIGVLLDLIRIKRISLEIGNEILKGFIHYGYFSPVDRLDEFL
jgi:predicted nucleic acid-binding protein